MENSFSDFIDLDALKQMILSNYNASGVPVGIIDAVTGEVYAGVGWQRICSDFHRKHPETRALCVESDTMLSGKIKTGESIAYKCKNGLWDIGIPVMCEGKHIVTIFLGQFRYEDEIIDRELFTEKARLYGFPVADYLAALEEVPVFSREKVSAIIEYNQSLAKFLSRQIEDRAGYEREALQRKKAESMHADLFHNTAVGVVYQDRFGAITNANKASQKILGLSLEQMEGRKAVDPRWQTIYKDGSPFPGERHPPMLALRTGKPVRDVIMGVYNPEDKQNHWLLINATPQFYQDEPEPYQVFSTFNDITDRVIAEKELQKVNNELEEQIRLRTYQLSEKVHELETIFNNSRVGIMVLKKGRVIARVNDRMADILGYDSPEEMIGLPTHRFHLTEQRYHEFGEKYYNRLRQKEILQLEYQLKRKNGVPVWCTLSGKALDRKAPVDLDKGVIWIIDDISEKKHAENERVRTEELLRLQSQIIRQVHDSIISFDTDGIITTWNGGSERLFQYTADEIIGKHLSLIYPEEFHAELGTEIIPFLLSNDRLELETELIRKDGNQFHALVSLSALKNDSGQVYGIIGYAIDISHRIEVENKLRKSELKFRTLFNIAAIPMCYAGNDGDILDVNSAFNQVFGYTRKDIPTLEDWWVRAYPDSRYRERVVGIWERAIEKAKREKKQIESIEYRVTCKNGDERNVIISGTTFEGAFLAIFIDITDRKRAEQELDRSNKELEQFAYVASHDLQEPLRAVVGFLQLLQLKYKEQLDEKGLHYIDRSLRAGSRMQNLINDLLKLSRVNARVQKLNTIDLNEIINRIKDNIQHLIHEKNVRMDYPELPEIYADDSQIESLFQNLIINGIKYNTSSEPTIELGFRDRGDRYSFFVKDNGIGIPPNFHERIFNVFQRLHTEKEYSGTGIGLALCKKIVEQHQGLIRVESVPDEGSTFEFTLPKPRIRSKK